MPILSKKLQIHDALLLTATAATHGIGKQYTYVGGQTNHSKAVTPLRSDLVSLFCQIVAILCCFWPSIFTCGKVWTMSNLIEQMCE